MRAVAIAVLLVLVSAAHASAQTAPSATQQRAIRQARIKIWTGIAVASAGAILAPLTSSEGTSDASVVPAVGLMAAGSGLVYWGFRQQQQAVRPSSAFGVTLGRTKGVVVRRSW